MPAVSALSHRAWSTGAYVDHLYPRTGGERPANFEAYHHFRKALRRAMEADPEIHRRAIRVAQMLDPSSVLPRDRILAEFGSEGA
jgi:hypothetical protein